MILNTFENNASVSLFVRAHITSDFEDGPKFAKITLSNDLICKINQLYDLFVQHNLSSISIAADPDYWAPADVVEELNLKSCDLEVSEFGFWFKAYPKYSDCVETSMIYFNYLKKVLAENSSDTIFYEINPEEFEDDISSIEGFELI